MYLWFHWMSYKIHSVSICQSVDFPICPDVLFLAWSDSIWSLFSNALNSFTFYILPIITWNMLFNSHTLTVLLLRFGQVLNSTKLLCTFTYFILAQTTLWHSENWIPKFNHCCMAPTLKLAYFCVFMYFLIYFKPV